MPHPGFYTAKGQQPFRGTFRSPLPLARVTSRFNPKRMHPVLHVVMPHNGIDFGASSGTPVFASASGTVHSAGDGGPCGNMVQIEHTNNLTTAYCHLSRIVPGLHPGQHVEARQLVGFVGQTGRATGPHLHFAVKRGGSFIDPMVLKMDGVRTLPPADRDAFAKLRADLDVALEAVALPSADGVATDDKDDKDDAKDEPGGEE
jgi:murein DD-endopeptidase MepM/ murein hydrolase activator NlpD